MNLIARVRAMDRRLRVMLIATALLIVPQIGQFIAIRDINTSGHESTVAVLFMFATIFFVPTSLILTVAIIATIRRSWRSHERLALLGAINLLLVLSVT